MNAPTTIATAALFVSIAWTIFLVYDVRGHINPPSKLRSLGLLCHNIPAMFWFFTAKTAQSADDAALVWLAGLLIFRYWRTIASIYFFLQYKLAVASTDFQLTPNKDCTVIVSTVGPDGNIVFDEMVAAVIINRPARIIFSTPSKAEAKRVLAHVETLIPAIEAGTSAYQMQHSLGPANIASEILVLDAGITNKRHQIVHAFSEVDTDIIVMCDDTAIWNPRFLLADLPAFESEKVGQVGTRKWVKRMPRPRDPTKNFFAGLWGQYVAGFWNCIGGIYLIRHNFEFCATNTADGGVFCISARTSLIRTCIVKNASFTHAFLNEYVFGVGPIKADDDKFISRWVVNQGWEIKVQSSKEATMTTVLGLYPIKFPEQCHRWSRTTFRQSPVELLIDRTIWWKSPWTDWLSQLPWLYNAALFRDGLAVFTVTRTDMYAQSGHGNVMLCALIALIWASKLAMTIPWYWTHPADFFLYFLIPAAPLFAYRHSLLKVKTAYTWYDLTWSGRKLK